MLGSLPLRSGVAVAVTLMIAVGCGSTVTNVGSIIGDSGTPEAPGPTGPDGSPSGGDASPDAQAADGATDAHADAHDPCAAGACGVAVCGRDECGHTCGTCPGSPAQGGCFVGNCNASCPGTPCIDHNGEHICEGGRGGHACAGGSLGIQICTCTAGGPDAWTSCGACL